MKQVLVILVWVLLSGPVVLAAGENNSVRTRIVKLIDDQKLGKGGTDEDLAYLAQHWELAVALIEPHLEETDPKLAIVYWTMLAYMPKREVALKYTIWGLTAEDQEIRQSALQRGLADFADQPEVAKAYLQELRTSKHGGWLTPARRLNLNTFPEKKALRVILEEFIRSDHQEKASNALFLLAKYDDDAARTLVRKHASTLIKEPGLRYIALALTGDGQALEQLLNVIRGNDPEANRDRDFRLGRQYSALLDGLQQFSHNKTFMSGLVEMLGDDPKKYGSYNQSPMQYSIAANLAKWLGVPFTAGDWVNPTGEDIVRIKRLAREKLRQDPKPTQQP